VLLFKKHSYIYIIKQLGNLFTQKLSKMKNSEIPTAIQKDLTTRFNNPSSFLKIMNSPKNIKIQVAYAGTIEGFEFIVGVIYTGLEKEKKARRVVRIFVEHEIKASVWTF